MEFIHPFADGNGRMGRLWQAVILSRWQPVMVFLPVETVIKARQDLYYQQLSQADSRSDCTEFILFLLEALRDARAQAMAIQPAAVSPHQEKMRVEMKVETQVEKRVKTPQAILAELTAEPTITLKQVAERIGKSTSTVERLPCWPKTGDYALLGRVRADVGRYWSLIPASISNYYLHPYGIPQR
ncbi:Fic family protein [Aeromonas sp. QDB20]|uniref:Fic family protein n=1 Tax=Aeromonas sp. QDB20 TaxID=2989835 RepID=UPI002FDB6856